MTFESSEVKSGVFVVLCFLVLTVLTFNVSDFQALKHYKELKVQFNAVNGLEVNAPVHFAGKSVGKVNSIVIRDADPVVEVTLEVDKDTPVRTDSEVFVDMLGLLGEKFVAIVPGKRSSPLLEPGATLKGTETVPIHDLVREMDELTKTLIPLMKKADRLVGNHEEDLDAVLSNAKDISQNLKEMTEDLKHHPWKLVRKDSGRKHHFLFF